MRSATKFIWASPIRATGDIEIVPGIHLSFHMEIKEPSPTHLIKLLCKASLPAMIASHVTEENFGTVACIKSLNGYVISTLKNTGTQRVGVGHQPPAMLTEKSCVEQLELLETHAPLHFRWSKKLPHFPVHGTMIKGAAPPILRHTGRQTLANFFG